MEYRQNRIPVGIEERGGDPPRITGYAAVFYRADDPSTEFRLGEIFAERIERGAFDKTLERGDVAALFSHRHDQVLGHTQSGTLRLSIDDRGLKYEIDPPDTQLGRDVVTSIRRGDIRGSSFGFDIPSRGARYETDDEGRELQILREINLHEVSPVVFPAYKGTSTDVRTISDLILDKQGYDLKHKVRKWTRLNIGQ